MSDVVGMNRAEVLKQQFKNEQSKTIDLMSAVEKPLTLDERLAVLEELGRDDLVKSFKQWRPRVSKAKKRGAPLDQRVSITVTSEERFSLDSEIRRLKAEKSSISMSQFIRNRALGSVDIQGWRQIAADAIADLNRISNNASQLRKRRSQLIVMVDSEEEDEDQIFLYNGEIVKIQDQLKLITAQNEKRTHRLAGRMSMAEAETVKWRAQRLQLSASDYLRMLIFGLEPNSSADSHMSLDAKFRFYFGIIDVADNGWGETPKIYNCSQCENYMDEIQRLRAQLDQNKTFADAGI